MKKYVYLLIMILATGFIFGQDYNSMITTGLHGGGGYMVSQDATYNSTIIAGITFIGHAESSLHKTDYGFFSFFLKEPDAPIIHATKAQHPNKIEITWKQDVISPPALHSSVQDVDNIFILYRDGVQFGVYGSINENSPFSNSHDGHTFDYDVSPGAFYNYEVKSKNDFAGQTYGDRGADIGFISPNGRVTGMIVTPYNNSPVPGIKVSIEPSLGKSLKFEGAQYGRINDNVLLKPDSSVTIEVWFRANQDGVLISKYNDGNTLGQYRLEVENNYLKGTITGRSEGSHFIISSATCRTGWNYGAIVFDKGELSLYLNEDVDIDSCDFNALYIDNYVNDDLYLGSGGGQDNYFHGMLDELRIWSSARSLEDITLFKDITLNDEATGLLAYFQFNEGIGTKSFDRSVNEFMVDFDEGGAVWGDINSPVANAGFTDDYGNFIVEGIFYGEGTTFNVIPEGEHHEFSPQQRTISLGPNNPAADGANFEDIAMLMVTGFSRYSNTTCPIVGASVLQGSNLTGWNYLSPPVYTDSEGRFDIEISPTTTINLRLAIGQSVTEDFTDEDNDGDYDPPELYTDLNNSLDCSVNELFIDLNGNGVHDPTGESYDDLNGSGAYEAAEPFNDFNGNGTWDDAEFYYDLNNNGQLDDGEPFDDIPTSPYYNGIYDDGETFTDTNANGVYDVGEPFTDDPEGFEPNGVWDDEEPYTDINENGQYDENDSFTDLDADGVYDYLEPSTDLNGNGSCDDGEPFSDWNNNGERDVAVYDFEHIDDSGTQRDTWMITNILEPELIPGAFEAEVLFEVSGKVVGGTCDADIGESVINIVPLNGCQASLQINTVDGHFSENLLPLQYHVSVSRGGVYIDPDISNYITQHYGTIALDLSEDTALDYIYKSPIMVSASDFPLYDTQNNCSVPATDSYPYLERQQSHHMEIDVYEEYDDFQSGTSSCSADSGSVMVYDDIRDQFNTPFELTYQNGRAHYYTIGGFPNLSGSGDHPYQKQVYIIAEDENDQTATDVKWAYVLGKRFNPSEFISASPQVPLFILRDPPGDGSYSYLTQGQSYCSAFSFTTESSFEAGVHVTVSLAPDFAIEIPFVPAIDVDNTFDIGAGLSVGFGASVSEEGQMCLDVSETYSTDNDGDVFVGASISVIYGVADVILIGDRVDKSNPDNWIVIEDCVPNQQQDLYFSPNGISSTYIFSEGHIQREVIPELMEVVANPNTPQDIMDQATASLTQWQEVLVYNNSLKLSATPLPDGADYSLASGASYEYSTTTSLTESHTFSFDMFINAEVSVEVGTNINGIGVVGGFNVGTGLSMGESVTQEYGTSKTVGAFFNDDDLGDEFQFTIKTDNVNGTLVFDIQGGKSSCPWEYPTSPRDGLQLQVTPPNIPNILPGESGVFTFQVGNISNTDEDRMYKISLDVTTNPDGLSFSGIPANDFEVQNDATVSFTISVDQGPLEHDYSDIRFLAYPVCEYDHWASGNMQNYIYSLAETQQELVDEGLDESYFGVISIFDEAELDASWAQPCTEIDFIDLDENWFINQYDSSVPVNFVVSEPAQDILENILFQYQLVEQDRDDWITAFTVLTSEISESGTFAGEWDVSNFNVIVDGSYEIRLKSSCLGGDMITTSSVLSGTIDRASPQVYGEPEPVDGVLNANDQISIEFDEPVDCGAVGNGSVSLYGITSGNIAVSISCAGAGIVVEPNIHNSFIENDDLVITLSGIQDIGGNIVIANPNADPDDQYSARWAFSVNRNPVAWSQPNLEIISYIGEGASFTMVLNNIGASSELFEFGSDFIIPEWLTVSPMFGEVNPGGSVEIFATVSENLSYGEENETLYAETLLGDEPLMLKVISMCRPPDWSVNIPGYQYQMNMVVDLNIEEEPSVDEFDRVAVYVGEEIRGWADLEAIQMDDGTNYVAFLTIYSNSQSGEQIEFHIWDNDACQELWEIAETYPFVSGNLIGSVTQPEALNANGAVAQIITASQGWSWISLSLNHSDMSVDKVMSFVSAQGGDWIGSQSSYAQYSVGSSAWEGPLNQLNNESMYQINLSSADEVIFVGFPVSVDTNAIALDSGWTWIAYTPQISFPVETALGSLSSSTDDIIAGQYGFALYTEGLGWIGSLDYLSPGQGYMIRSAMYDVLTYPFDNNRNIEPVEYAVNVLPETPWDFNPHEFKHYMVITALLESDSLGINNPEDAVAAVVGNEVRGVSKPVYVPELDAHRIFLMVYSDSYGGETVGFKIWNAEEEIMYNGSEVMGFEAFTTMGTPLDPIILTQSPLGIGDIGYVPDEFSLSQNYPNPFNPFTKLGFGLPNDEHVTIRIYNLLGQEVNTLVNDRLTAGYRFIIWNGTNNLGSAATSGVYIVVMEAESFRQTRKMVLLK